MLKFDEFLRSNEPAYGENESQYFTRLASEFHHLNKLESRRLRKQKMISRFKRLLGR